MGGYGITEDCPGFLGHKWMDAQLEATYEGPEAVQRRQLSVTMTDELFLAQFEGVDPRDARTSRRARPAPAPARSPPPCSCGSGRYQHLAERDRRRRREALPAPRQGVTFPLADALCWLLAARMPDPRRGRARRRRAGGRSLGGGARPAQPRFFADLCHVQAARAAGEVGPHLRRAGLRLQPPPGVGRATGARACCQANELDALEALIPGLARLRDTDVIEPTAAHPARRALRVAARARPTSPTLRVKLDGCLTGAQLAKDRAAEALSQGDDPRGAGLPAVADLMTPEPSRAGAPDDGGGHRLRRLRPGHGRLPHDALAPPRRRPTAAARERAPRRACRCRWSATSAPTISASASRAW